MSQADEKCICEICKCGKHKCSHIDNDWVYRGGIGELQTEYGAQYPGKIGNRSQPIRPFQGIVSSNELFNGITTQKADYDVERSQAIRPPFSAIQSGEFDGSTTHKSDFYQKQVERSRSFRPPINAIQSGEFSGTTTNRADFDRKEANHPLSFRPQRSQLRLEGVMDGITTTQADFDQKKTDRVTAIRPASHVVDKSQPFHGSTTYKEGYLPLTGDRQKSFRPGQELHLSNAAFDGITTQKADFTRKKIDICPAEKVLTRDKSYEFVGTRRGHDFYHHRVTHGNRQNSSIVPVA